MGLRKDKKKNKKKRGHDPRGRRFTNEQKREALALVEGGMTRVEVARKIGTTVESLRKWILDVGMAGTTTATGADEGAEDGQASSPAPVLSPGGLSPLEVAAILEYKKKHSSYGPEQVQAQLRRFKGWRLARKAIARVFKDNGYELVHVASRPQGDENPHRWEAPRRNAVWQADLTDLRVGPEKRALAVTLDDFSRFVVGFKVFESPTGEGIVELLERAIGLHGKPESLYTDRGGVFLDWNKETSFQRFLAEQLIDHIVGKPYKPQGKGKVEALFKSIRRELWNVRHFESWDEALPALGLWFQEYNHSRAHMGIDGLTPADKFFGRAEQVRAHIDAVARGRMAMDNSTLIEETEGAALEVLRFVVVDGQLQLRLLGQRFLLGELDG